MAIFMSKMGESSSSFTNEFDVIKRQMNNAIIDLAKSHDVITKIKAEYSLKSEVKIMDDKH